MTKWRRTGIGIIIGVAIPTRLGMGVIFRWSIIKLSNKVVAPLNSRRMSFCIV